MSSASAHHKYRVSQIGCVICRRVYGVVTEAVELHHIAEGSGKRSDFMIAALCVEHHRGANGLHGLSPPVFCARYRVPNENEYGLLAWVNEDLALAALHRLPMAAA